MCIATDAIFNTVRHFVFWSFVENSFFKLLLFLLPPKIGQIFVSFSFSITSGFASLYLHYCTKTHTHTRAPLIETTILTFVRRPPRLGDFLEVKSQECKIAGVNGSLSRRVYKVLPALIAPKTSGAHHELVQFQLL